METVRQLAGVGDAELGEWREFTGYAFHLRRRLSAREQRQVGPVVDIRCSLEAKRRAGLLPSDILGLVPAHVLAEEIGPA